MGDQPLNGSRLLSVDNFTVKDHAEREPRKKLCITYGALLPSLLYDRLMSGNITRPP